MAKSQTVLLPPKSEQDGIIQNLMLKDDPNGKHFTSAPESKIKTRRGPKHKGAQELAQLYPKGKKIS